MLPIKCRLDEVLEGQTARRPVSTKRGRVHRLEGLAFGPDWDDSAPCLDSCGAKLADIDIDFGDSLRKLGDLGRSCPSKFGLTRRRNGQLHPIPDQSWSISCRLRNRPKFGRFEANFGRCRLSLPRIWSELARLRLGFGRELVSRPNSRQRWPTPNDFCSASPEVA